MTTISDPLTGAEIRVEGDGRITVVSPGVLQLTNDERDDIIDALGGYTEAEFYASAGPLGI